MVMSERDASAEAAEVTEEGQETMPTRYRPVTRDSDGAELIQVPSDLKEARPWRKQLISQLAHKYLRGLVYVMACGIGVVLLLVYSMVITPLTVRKLAGFVGFLKALRLFALWIAVDLCFILSASFIFVGFMSLSFKKPRGFLAHLLFLFLDMFFIVTSLITVSHVLGFLKPG
jgi:hypothetical protein